MQFEAEPAFAHPRARVRSSRFMETQDKVGRQGEPLSNNSHDAYKRAWTGFVAQEPAASETRSCDGVKSQITYIVRSRNKGEVSKAELGTGCLQICGRVWIKLQKGPERVLLFDAAR